MKTIARTRESKGAVNPRNRKERTPSRPPPHFRRLNDVGLQLADKVVHTHSGCVRHVGGMPISAIGISGYSSNRVQRRCFHCVVCVQKKDPPNYACKQRRGGFDAAIKGLSGENDKSIVRHIAHLSDNRNFLSVVSVRYVHILPAPLQFAIQEPVVVDFAGKKYRAFSARRDSMRGKALVRPDSAEWPASPP